MVRVGLSGRVATVTMDRPAVHNAFNAEFIVELTAALARAGADPEVRAVVLAAEGASFSAGADVNWMRAMAGYSEAENHADALKLADLMRTLAYLPKPTIARVQGSAFGGGVGLIACCDVAIAAESAKFGLTEAKLGLVPAVISPYVIQAIGPRQARRYFATAEIFDAAGLRDVAEDAIAIDVLHPSFAEWWEPYTFGVGPAGDYVQRLDDEARGRLKTVARERLGAGPFTVTATAWAARGTV